MTKLKKQENGNSKPTSISALADKLQELKNRKKTKVKGSAGLTKKQAEFDVLLRQLRLIEWEYQEVGISPEALPGKMEIYNALLSALDDIWREIKTKGHLDAIHGFGRKLPGQYFGKKTPTTGKQNKRKK